jgi:hypothetical protein
MGLAKFLVAPMERRKLCHQLKHLVSIKEDLFVKGWRGFLAHATGSLISSGITTTAMLPGLDVDMSSFQSRWITLAGASILGTCISYPFDVAYTHRASGSVVSRQYLRGLPLGVGLSALHTCSSLGVLSFLGLIFPLHKPGDTFSDLDFARSVVVGYSSSLIGSLIVYPGDTVRRRMILGASFKDAIQRRSFFSGLSWHLLKSVPECAVFTAAYILNSRLYFSEQTN